MADDQTITLKIINIKGLHARAAAKFVKTSEQFDADIWVCRNGYEVSALSIMGLMMLAAHFGTEITVRASGEQAQEALSAVSELILRRFDEEG